MNKKCVFKFYSNSCEVQSSFWRNISQDYYCLRGYIIKLMRLFTTILFAVSFR